MFILKTDHLHEDNEGFTYRAETASKSNFLED